MAKIESIGRVSNASAKKCTGKSWEDWVQILNAAGAKIWTHQEIVAFLRKKFKPGPWWEQGITLGYELHSGRRVEGQNLKGEFHGMASRTLPLSQKKMWAFLVSAEGQRHWLNPISPLKFKPKAMFEVEGGIFGEVRTMKAPQRMRMTWQDTEWVKPSIVQVMVIPRAGNKCVLVFQHEALKDTRLRTEMKRHWKSVLDSMHTFFSTSN